MGVLKRMIDKDPISPVSYTHLWGRSSLNFISIIIRWGLCSRKKECLGNRSLEWALFTLWSKVIRNPFLRRVSYPSRRYSINTLSLIHIYITWNSGRYRYFNNEWMAQILRDILSLKKGTEDETLMQEFYDHFCHINHIDQSTLPQPNGSLKGI